MIDNIKIKRVIKRDGRIVKFDGEKIYNAILKAMTKVNEVNTDVARKVADSVITEINNREEIPVEDIQDCVEKNLILYSTYKVIKEYILYRAQRTEMREYNLSLNVEDDLNLTQNAVSLLEGRYLKNLSDGKKETPAQMFKRTARHISAIEKRYGNSQSKWQKIFYNMMANQVFFPNIPCLSNSGIDNLNFLASCYVLSPEDSIESIFSVAKDCAIITKSGGGIGLNLSDLRPRNDIVKTTGKVSSGVVGFLPVFNSIIESVKQGGMRRGAALALLRIDHPDILEFINCKKEEGKFSNFNLSVALTDKFMQCVSKDTEFSLINPRTKKKTDSIRARYLLNLIAQNAWESGDPGIVFYDTYNKNNPTPSLGPMYKNACLTGDTLIAVADGRGAISIKQLVDENKDIPVYCKDDRGWTHIRKAFNIQKTGENKKILKVILDDNSYLRITENHKFYLKDGSKVEAKDLIPGMPLMRFDRTKYSKTSKNKGMRKSDYWEIRKAKGNIFQEHRLISEFILGRKLDKSEAVHHINFNGLDNATENLFVLPAIDHVKKFHDISGDKNPLNILKINGEFEEYKKRNPFYNTKGENNPRFGVKLSKEQIEKQKTSLKLRYSTDLIHQFKGKTKENCESLRKLSEKLKGPRIARKILICEQCGKEKEVRITDTHRFCSRSCAATWRNLHKKELVYNHKVFSIVEDGYEDVYNMTVENFHNYCVITSNTKDKQSGITLANCGETSLLPNEPCVLGSINLTKFVVDSQISWSALQKTINNAVHFLDDTIDASDYPLSKIKEMTLSNRKIGLGVMGFADLLYLLEIPYNSKEAVKLADKIMEFIYIEARKASEQLAKERGSFPNFSISIYTEPIRNASLTVIAPTGEISLLANCSPGIEPNYGLVFKRQTTLSVKELVSVNHIFESVAKREGFFSLELLDKVIRNNGKATGIKEIPEKWQKVFVTALEISPEDHLQIQSKFQAHVDNSISKTINMPNTSTVSDVEDIIKEAYDLKCDGVTIFRDGCRETQVMTTGENTCPECKVELIYSEGCYKCPTCGFGHCSIV